MSVIFYLIILTYLRLYLSHVPVYPPQWLFLISCIPGPLLRMVLLIHSFTHSPCVCMDFLQVLWFPFISQNHMSVGGLATLSVYSRCEYVCTWCSMMDWNLIQGVFPPHVQCSGFTTALTRINWLLKISEWMQNWVWERWGPWES